MATAFTTTTFPRSTTRTSVPPRVGFAADNTSRNNSQEKPSSFWDEIHKIRTNGFGCNDDNRKWSFNSRKSHILDTKGHYAWERELNCYQLQKLPTEVFPHNTLEISMKDSKNNFIRIRFGALEGLRGWISLDAEPIPTTHARDSAHWKFVGAHGQLPKSKMALTGKNPTESILSTSYDYAFTTLYKGGTDCNQDDYHYLSPNSSSFVPKHSVGENDLMVARSDGIAKVRVRKPICKCKSDGGRKPLVSGGTNNPSNKSMPQFSETTSPPPPWIMEENTKVDIEGMLGRAAEKNPNRPFLFREDVDLWSDDLHDNGIAWLKARCFVCQEGWACLLRNFIRVDGVTCRVIDTRYQHTFGTTFIQREHSWREGPWEGLMRAIPRNFPLRGPINDSIAARFLPLKKKPVTERLSLNINLVSNPTTMQKLVSPEQLFIIHDKSIDDAIPVPNDIIRDALGISFVLKRSTASCLEAISSENHNGKSFKVSSLWSRNYGMISQNAMILNIQISPDPTDGGRLAIGDDRGKVNVWRLSTGEALWGVPVAPSSILMRLEQNPCFESARLWVDHLVWSADGSMVGASAGRNTVLASNGRQLACLESKAGTVTGLAFSKHALAVASYGEVQWLTPHDEERAPETLKRQGAAIECMDVSPNGEKVAVGYLDKTLRVFHMGARKTDSAPFTRKQSTKSSATDWVGFNASVKSVRFNHTGEWLAAMGGSTILVICDTLNARAVPPIVCRTPGQTTADGGDGTCQRFEGIEWSGKQALAALAKTRDIYIFQFSKGGASNVSLDAWPIQVSPIRIVSPPFARPSASVPTRFAFFSDSEESNGVSFFMLDRVVAGNNSGLEEDFGSKLDFGTSSTDDRLSHDRKRRGNETLSFRTVL